MLEKIRAYVEGLIEDRDDLFLVDVVSKGKSGTQKLIVLLDGDKGVDIDICASVSRQLGHWIEENELMDGKYFLEVSSPGLDMPIVLHRQYVKNKGRSLKVELLEGEKIRGKLLDVTENGIKLEDLKTKKEEMIDFKNINRTFVEVSFK